MYNRICKPLLSHSFFLFGARGTGKTTLLKNLFTGSHPLWINLLDPSYELALSQKPAQLLELWEKNPSEWIIIDEVQKIPPLLDMVHLMIEDHQVKFALTGSSARKLKRGGANLLAGRAFMNLMFPLTYVELGKDFNLQHYLQWGGLPTIWRLKSDDEKNEYLKSYAYQYLKEEIQQEQIVRKIPLFRRFLEVAAQSNSEILNYSKIGRDVGTDDTSIARFYQILEDTLLGFFLEPYHSSLRKRLAQKPKFYFFDLGVTRVLMDLSELKIQPGNSHYGKLFEHFIIFHIWAFNSLLRKNYKLYYLRTKDNFEIDLVIQRPGQSTLFIEIKSSEKIDDVDIHKVARFMMDVKNGEAWILSREPVERRTSENVHILPWNSALNKLFLD
ncbi:MAG: ATP-binding protein [Deltaproteobacteria bacterium]|nr:ATP-binding protein [Deltaproteobacteria bacterium]